ncbi:uncharacterized protein LOC114970617 isoform X1 [Acropora millepora]|uniref:uncharacterized protein LOC114970617 isoform X1 n=1 Tax=Acropora millepora TaxID=45264 RepID=UPI001CF5EE6C|nr:uncharacterized protein LOC114970617 isoform X1 [Acropora millepora]
MRLQSHEDCSPVLIIHYQPTDKTVAVLRSLMQSAECLKALGDVNIHVALIGSSFADNALGKQGKRDGGASDVELCIMHPTMTRGRMVVGNIVSGHERNFKEKLIKAAEEACQAATALAAHRTLIQEDCVSKISQEGTSYLSELNAREKGQRCHETNSQTEVETDDTIVDTDEVRQKRLLALSEQAESSKRQRRVPDEGNDGDDSETVTLKTF